MTTIIHLVHIFPTPLPSFPIHPVPLPSCSWGHIPQLTLLHLVSHYQNWDIQLDGLCNNGTQWTHFKLKSRVYERHGKGGQSSMIKKNSLPFFLTDAISAVEEAKLSYSNWSILLFLDSLQEMKWANEGMQHEDREYCSYERHVYTRCVNQSINATGNKNYEQNCEPSVTRWNLCASLCDTSM